MKIKVSDTRRATMPVSALVPTENGTNAKITMKVTYELLPDTDFQNLVNPEADGGALDRLRAVRHVDAELLRKTVVDWKSDDLVGDGDDPLPFSGGALELLIEHYVPIRTAMAEAYVKAHQGEGRRKN